MRIQKITTDVISDKLSEELALPRKDRVLVRAAFRCTVATVTAMVLCGVLLGKSEVAFASYAAFGLTSMCDFDGTAKERTGANLAASAVGLLGVFVGSAVAFSFSLTIVVMFVVSFCFAFARAFRGFLSRSAVAPQLGFILAVVAQDAWTKVVPNVEAWGIGSAVAIICSVVILPRHHSTSVRRALSAWCTAAAALTRSLNVNDATPKALENLRRHRDSLVALAAGTQEWPGSMFAPQRALSALFVVAESGTSSFERFDKTPLRKDAHYGELGEQTARAFEVAALAVVGGKIETNSLRVENIWDELRHDYDESVAWVEKDLTLDPQGTIEHIEQHHPLRALAVIANVVQRYALISQGEQLGAPDFAPAARLAPLSLIRANLTLGSVWFLNAMRAGVAMAVAIGVERHFNFSHGYWIILAALSIVNATFTRHDARKAAFDGSLGILLGAAGGALLIVAHCPPLGFLLLIPLAIFASKWATGAGPILGQASFAFYSITVFSYLGWPPEVKVAENRFVWALIGIAIGLVLTYLAFPRGHRYLVNQQRAISFEEADVVVERASNLLVGMESDRTLFERELNQSIGQVQRFMDLLDSTFHAANTIPPELSRYLEDEAWLLQAVFVASTIAGYLDHAYTAVDDPALRQVFDSPTTERLTLIRILAQENPALLRRHPRVLLSTVWSAQWLHDLARQRPQNAPEKFHLADLQ